MDFQMLKIQEPDREVLRFSYVDDISNPGPKIITRRFKRVVFGNFSNPFLLNEAVKHRMDNNIEELIQDLQKISSMIWPQMKAMNKHSFFTRNLNFAIPRGKFLLV